MDVTTQLIRHVLNSNLEAIPEQAIERAKLSILDTIACAIGGSNDPIAR
ncbi:MAG: MmgE/PrpD family protein, partial [Mesorhizobium sp.]